MSVCCNPTIGKIDQLTNEKPTFDKLNAFGGFATKSISVEELRKMYPDIKDESLQQKQYVEEQQPSFDWMNNLMQRIIVIENFITQNYKNDIANIHSKISIQKDSFEDLVKQNILNVQERIDGVKINVDTTKRFYAEYGQRLKEVERYQDVTHEQYKYNTAKSHERYSLTPHKCPVCNGEGFNGWHPCKSGESEKQKDSISCEGKGIVWG